MSRQSHMSFFFESVKFLLNADPPKLLFFTNAVFFNTGGAYVTDLILSVPECSMQ